jgi:DNA-binding transcriptional LysR family regulator
MDLHQLYIFTKVVEHKSFSKAAEDIYLSQSTVSSHIHSLEKSLNAALFDRVGRESILTPYGERLYEWALKLIQLKDEALLDLHEGMKDMKGKIRIAASSVPGQFIIPKMIKEFRKENHGVMFHVNQSSSKVVADKVLNGSADFGILGAKYENDKLRYIPLLKERLVLIAPYELELSSPIKIEDTLSYPYVMRNADSGTNSMVEQYLRKRQISKDQMDIIAYTDNSQSLIQFVKEGIGISIISEIAAKEYCDRDLIKILDLDDFNNERFFYLVYHINRTQSLISKKFIEQARDLVGRINGEV